ncbi:MAG: hypothetical protein ABSG68_07015 [Thermoguttaceae bacterium]
MRIVSIVLALAVSLTTVSKLSAADEPAKKAPRRSADFMVERMDAFVKDLTLTDDQKAKIADLKKEYGPKLKDALKKSEDILTAEQKTARAEAFKTAQSSGKGFRENREAFEKALNLSDEQKTRQTEARKQIQETMKAFRDKVMDVLTPEQKDQVKAQMQKMKDSGKGRRKNREEKKDGDTQGK